MRISEIFYSIQGEGELTGMPSVFVRTSGCNLRCRWCDTRYASWDPEGDELTTEEIIDQVLSYPAAKHCVLTGGEPMIARDIGQLTQALKDAGKHITIETAATVPPQGVACDLASLSPKLAHSTPFAGEIENAWIDRHEARRWNPEVIDAWLAAYPCQLKFVISKFSCLEEIDTLLECLQHPISPEKILLMPEGTDPGDIKFRHNAIIEHCKERGYRFCHRLHLELFGNTRGT